MSHYIDELEVDGKVYEIQDKEARKAMKKLGDVQGAIDDFNNATQSAINEAIDRMDAFVEEVGEQVDEAVQNAKNKAEEVVQNATDQMDAAIIAGSNRMDQAITAAEGRVDDIIDSLPEDYTETLGEISALKEDLTHLETKVDNLPQGGTGGLTEGIQNAIIEALNHVAWTDEYGSIYIRNLKRAFDGLTEDDPISVESIELEDTSGTYYVGDTFTIVANILPVDATNKLIEWSSDNPNVARVDNGTVTVVSEGSCVITATTVDGRKTATYTLTAKAQRQIVNLTIDDFTKVAALSSSATDYTITRVDGTSFNASKRAKFVANQSVSSDTTASVTITVPSKIFTELSAGSIGSDGNITNAVKFDGANVTAGEHTVTVTIKAGEKLAIAPVVQHSNLTAITATWEG